MKRKPVSAEEVLAHMDRLGIDRCVLVPPATEGDRNDLVLAASRQYPGRFGAVGRVPLGDPGARSSLGGWIEEPGMLGVRASFLREASQLLAEGRCEWLWQEAESADIPVMIYAPGHTAEIGAVARRYPHLRLIVDHLNLPMRVVGEELDGLVQELAPLVNCANVAVKVSGLPYYVEDSFPFRSLHKPIGDVGAMFGADRLLWGSDYTRLPCSYDAVLRLFTEELSCFSQEELTWVMGRSALKWLSWGDVVPAADRPVAQPKV